ncbi:4-hydroxybenzoate 3-monooxygenase [Tersicoccus sp. Bi-70]|uniref:4-hydroxybenzoate 3-monooxygenase n=1 Tax=Tersicoccus sp. Bi-70 TaxID=1897634 RepID=UPI0009777E9E|nr:4-hydroxybenzoate 3-monooxygenase [Tersicoccus sp. Bi-70]
MAQRRVVRTQVAIVGAGPAGLMLSHLLARSGVETVVVEARTRAEIETTIRAGILEHGSVRMLLENEVSDRVLREGYEHEGIELRFDGEGHRIDFRDLVGESVWLYPQTDVFMDLAAARERDGGDVRYGVRDTRVEDVVDAPAVEFTDADGVDWRIECEYLAGTDGSRSICRREVPETARRSYFREYPFAWFGILCEAPPSAPELMYANSPHGFALISQRTDTVQRMYFQCEKDTDPEQWSEDQIWAELQRRVEGNGFTLQRGPVFEKTVLPFRSFVCEPLRHGRMFLAGDAGHTVPPTGAKGLNLALADVAVLHAALADHFATGSTTGIDAYSDTALQRVWKAQHFSYWMTSMLHENPEANAFDRKRQLGELTSVVTSTAGSTWLAEAYTGWPGR